MTASFRAGLHKLSPRGQVSLGTWVSKAGSRPAGPCRQQRAAATHKRLPTSLPSATSHYDSEHRSLARRGESGQGAGLLICRVTARRQRQRTSTPQVLSSLGCGSRHIMAGASAASAWSCRRTGSRSPSVARCRMQRASSLARTFSMPLHLSVNQASSNAASRIASVLGSNDPLPSPRMFPLSDRILLEAGPPEHHHDMATLWSLPAMNCTRAMHGERSIAAVSAEALLGPYVCSLRSSASPRLPPSCLSPPSLLRRIVCSQAPLARCGNSGGPHRNLCAHLLQHVTLCCKPVLLRLAIQPSAGIP
jgi:hypothetical protein